MPLAIELAAARCRTLGPAQLAARLEGHPGLLAGGAARPGRHRSLDALVSWSYELLGEADRRLLARLSVLRGGFDLEVAERVCGGEPLAAQAIAGLLASLPDKSLVQVQAGAVIRYWLLETVRQFAAGRLAASGEETAVHARLLGWALEVARSAEAALPGPERTDWFSRLSAGQASIRAALSWALGGAEPEAGRDLAARLARWWVATGRYSEAGQFLAAAADAPGPAAAIAGDQSTSAAAVGEARAALGDRRQAITAAALTYAEGVMAWHRGELAEAERMAREATAQWHRCGNRMGACDGLEFLGVLAAARERFPDAARLLAAADAARPPLLAPGLTANRDAAARAVTQARDILGDDRFTQAWDQGHALALGDAVTYAARKGGGRKRPATGWASLTPAELEVVRLVGEGLRNDAIARRLFIAPGTVKVHLSHVFGKLGITTRAELAAQAASRDQTAG